MAEQCPRRHHGDARPRGVGMICPPCRVQHRAEQCEDTQAGREGVQRRCYCQHKPYRQAPSEQVAGPECDTDTAERRAVTRRAAARAPGGQP